MTVTRLLGNTPITHILARRLITHYTTLHRHNIIPALTVIHINRHRSSLSCRHNTLGHYRGINVRTHHILLPTSISRSRLLTTVRNVGTSLTIRKYLVFHPLPTKLSRSTITTTLSPTGSISSVAPTSLLAALSKQNRNFTPYATRTILTLLSRCNIRLSKTGITIINQSLIVNHPITTVLATHGTAIAAYRARAHSLTTRYHTTSVIITTIKHTHAVNISTIHRNRAVVSINVG